MVSILKWFLPVIGCLLVVIGLVQADRGLCHYLKASSTTSWPRVTGTVVSSDLDQRSARKSNDPTTRPSASGTTIKISTSSTPGNMVYGAAIRYSYHIAGLMHAGTRITLSDQYVRNQSIAQQTVTRYAAGRSVLVSYNPADPDDSVLEPGVHSSDCIGIPIGVACMLIGGGVPIIMLRFSGKPRLRVLLIDDDHLEETYNSTRDAFNEQAKLSDQPMPCAITPMDSDGAATLINVYAIGVNPLPHALVMNAVFKNGDATPIIKRTKAHKSLSAIPIVIYSASQDEKILMACLAAGAIRSISKGPQGPKGGC